MGTNLDALWQKEEPKIEAILRNEPSNQMPAGIPNELAKHTTAMVVAKQVKATLDFIRVGIQELISDLVGCYLFGPAALVCLGDFSAGADLDASPASCGNYPPWRLRLRKLVDFIGNDLQKAKAIQSAQTGPFIERLLLLEAIAKATKDIQAINSMPTTREAYKVIDAHWQTIHQQVLALLTARNSRRYDFIAHMEIIEGLILRLNEGLPPNEAGKWPDVKSATLPDILNSAWAHACLKEKQDTEWGTPENYESVCQLVLKGVESSYLTHKYGPLVANADVK